jgi:GNAT superfamily N-acetyltransferase
MSSGRRVEDLIRRATVADLPAMARIHVASGTPGLLTDLGEWFLRRAYYRRLLEDPRGRALAMDLDNKMVGFVTFSTDSERMYSSIFRGSILELGGAVIARSLRRPRVARDLLETVLQVGGSVPERAIKSEIVSLEIERQYQGMGFGYFLLRAAAEELRAMGATPIKARILQDFPAVERLYAQTGFVAGTPFRLHGRRWRFMLTPEAGSPTAADVA